MDRETRIKRLHYRATHRGTREADYMVGGFCATYASGWNDAELDWFELFLEEQDVDIMAWALGTAEVPQDWRGTMMDRFCRLDYLDPTPPA